MKKIKSLCMMVVCLMLFTTALHAYHIPNSTDEYYFDDANVLSSSLKQHIHDANNLLDQHAGAYIEVVCTEYINGNISSYAYQLFNDWSLSDDAVLLVIATKEENVWVTWGFGIDEKDSDFAEAASAILDQYFYDSFDRGQFEQAIEDTFDAMYETLMGLYGNPNASTNTLINHNNLRISFLDVVVFLFIVWLVMWMIQRMIRPKHRYHHTTNRPARYRYNDTRFHDSHRTNYHSPMVNRRQYHGSSSNNSTRRPSGSNSMSSHRPSSSSTRGSSSFSGRSTGGGTRGSGVGRRG